MNEPSPLSQYLPESPVAVPRAVERAYLWLVAGTTGVAAAGLVLFAVAAQSGADARRLAGAGSAPEALLGALATAHARPVR